MADTLRQSASPPWALHFLYRLVVLKLISDAFPPKSFNRTQIIVWKSRSRCVSSCFFHPPCSLVSYWRRLSFLVLIKLWSLTLNLRHIKKPHFRYWFISAAANSSRLCRCHLTRTQETVHKKTVKQTTRKCKKHCCNQEPLQLLWRHRPPFSIFCMRRVKNHCLLTFCCPDLTHFTEKKWQHDVSSRSFFRVRVKRFIRRLEEPRAGPPPPSPLPGALQMCSN